MFVVAVARLGFDTSSSSSLKDKRSSRQKIVQRVRNRFPVAIAEIESNDDHSRLVLGISVVSNDSRHAEAMIDKIIGFIEKIHIAPITFWERELINLGSLNDPFWDMEEEPFSDWETLKLDEDTEELH
jgi:uncharacterized protein